MTFGTAISVSNISGFCIDRSNRRPTRIILFRTVLALVFAEAGSNSPRKSATLPKGISAASLDVR
jgi:hypothetical protein